MDHDSTSNELIYGTEWSLMGKIRKGKAWFKQSTYWLDWREKKKIRRGEEENSNGWVILWVEIEKGYGRTALKGKRRKRLSSKQNW